MAGFDGLSLLLFLVAIVFCYVIFREFLHFSTSSNCFGPPPKYFVVLPLLVGWAGIAGKRFI